MPSSSAMSAGRSHELSVTMRTEEALSPRQVTRAAGALLERRDEWKALGSQGCVLSIGEQGFAMAADGVLRVQWDAV